MVATIQCASSSKATSGLIVRNTFEPVKFGKTILDFGQLHRRLWLLQALAWSASPMRPRVNGFCITSFEFRLSQTGPQSTPRTSHQKPETCECKQEQAIRPSRDFTLVSLHAA
jgi:hypothetical protein